MFDGLLPRRGRSTPRPERERTHSYYACHAERDEPGSCTKKNCRYSHNPAVLEKARAVAGSPAPEGSTPSPWRAGGAKGAKGKGSQWGGKGKGKGQQGYGGKGQWAYSAW